MSLSSKSLLVLLLSAAVPGGASAQSSRAAEIELEPVRRCHSTVRSAPADSLRIARALLAKPGVSPAVEAGAVTCRAIAETQLGQSTAIAASLQQLQRLLERDDLPRRDRLTVLFVTQALMIERGDSGQAMPLLQRMLDEAKADGDVPTQVMVLSGLSALHSQGLADNAGALAYLDRAIALTRTISRSPHDGDAMLHYNRAYALMLLERYAEADRALLEAERMARRIGGQDLLLYRMAGHRAEIQRATGHLDAAEAGLREVLAWQEKNDAQGKVITLQRLARVQLGRGSAEEAARLGNEALALARKISMVAETRSSLELMFEIETHRGNTAAALASGRELREMDQARMRGSAVERMNRLQADAEQTIGAPQAAASIQERRDRLLRNAALAGLVLVLAGAWWLQRRHRQQRRQLQMLGRSDTLTGLANRSEAERRLQALPSTTQGQRRTALLRIDLLDFKEFNDRHGQHAGDEALRTVAAALRRVADEHDLLARWGGRSLMVARSGTTCEAAVALAAHLQSKLSGLALADRGGDTLQVAVGLAPLPLFVHGSSSLDDSLQAIDRCMQELAAGNGSGWAALWGSAEARQVDIDAVLRAPLQAAAQGTVTLAGGGPGGWSGTLPAG